LERLEKADTILFDKTGTLTSGAEMTFCGELNEYELSLVASLASNTSHPLSKMIAKLESRSGYKRTEEFEEFKGEGICGKVSGEFLKLGSEKFVTGRLTTISGLGSRVYLSINGKVKGYFSIMARYRAGISGLIASLSEKMKVGVLSGDNDAERQRLSTIFPDNDLLRFEQMPQSKASCIRELQKQGRSVIMVGDGLNDSGALAASDAGIAVSDDSNVFSPSCDAILKGSSLVKLNEFLEFSRDGRKIIVATFVLSILYNLAGLFFAVQGLLSPLIAAILMPASSISIILFSTFTSAVLAWRKGL
jgi:Cu+-exporting ATPase